MTVTNHPHVTRRQMLEQLHKVVERKYYQRYPDKWMIEKFKEPIGSLDWTVHGGYENHQWDGTVNPFLEACKALANKQNVGIESATGTGKTYMVARLAYWFLDVYEDSIVIATAPKLTQLKTILWKEVAKGFKKFRKMNNRAQLYSLRILPDGRMRLNKHMDEEGNDAHQMIGVVSGVGADEESATKMQGYHAKNMLFLLEETAGISPAVVKAIVNTCTGENNVICAIGNPDSQTDALHLFCERPNTHHIIISGYDHPNVVNKKEIIPGAVTIQSIDERREEYGEDSPFFKSRARGIAPAQSSDSLIMHEWIVACCTQRKEYDHNILDQNELNDDGTNKHIVDCNNALGVDVANSEAGDKACLVWGKRNVMTRINEFQCPNANALADNLVNDDEHLRQHGIPIYHTWKLKHQGVDHQSVGVDAVGVGVGTINEFARLNYSVIGLQGGPDMDCIPVDREGNPKYTFASLRAQMMFQFRLDLMHRDFIVDIADPRTLQEFVKQCTLVKYSISDKMIKIESKDQIKKRLGGKSPNIFDAAVYWNWVRKNRKLGQSTIAPYILR